jgi:hypothetical protein
MYPGRRGGNRCLFRAPAGRRLHRINDATNDDLADATISMKACASIGERTKIDPR